MAVTTTSAFLGSTLGCALCHNETDEIGYRAASDPVRVHDLHATILHLLALNHKRLTCLHNGRRCRLAGVAGNVLTRLPA